MYKATWDLRYVMCTATWGFRYVICAATWGFRYVMCAAALPHRITLLKVPNHIRAINGHKQVNLKDMLRIYGLFNDVLAAKTSACIGTISTFSSDTKRRLRSCKTSPFYRTAK